MGMTENEIKQSVYQAVKDYILKHQYAPTYREIQDMSGVKSTSTVHKYIHILIDDGLLETDIEGHLSLARAVRLTGYEIVKKNT